MRGTNQSEKQGAIIGVKARGSICACPKPKPSNVYYINGLICSLLTRTSALYSLNVPTPWPCRQFSYYISHQYSCIVHICTYNYVHTKKQTNIHDDVIEIDRHTHTHTHTDDESNDAWSTN